MVVRNGSNARVHHRSGEHKFAAVVVDQDMLEFICVGGQCKEQFTFILFDKPVALRLFDTVKCSEDEAWSRRDRCISLLVKLASVQAPNNAKYRSAGCPVESLCNALAMSG